MLGKTFFLDRAKSRSLDWIGRYPALECSSRDPQSLSGGRQIVVAAADDVGVRCVFFSSIGSVRDFSATWAELGGARQWWHFVGRWYYWVADCESTLAAIRQNCHQEVAGYAHAPDGVNRHDDETFLGWLDSVERRARRNLGICAPQAMLESIDEYSRIRADIPEPDGALTPMVRFAH
ncbi:hypothetical protein P3T43_006273 [Paraburkholderia sp. GAS41]|jgi:hypothetical protein|uniref:hypothetical protein n=1 Tax=Paraburkholderia sp. GAS41 TaxID=3035134 RepID=UPI003D1F2269